MLIWSCKCSYFLYEYTPYLRTTEKSFFSHQGEIFYTSIPYLQYRDQATTFQRRCYYTYTADTIVIYMILCPFLQNEGRIRQLRELKLSAERQALYLVIGIMCTNMYEACKFKCIRDFSSPSFLWPSFFAFNNCLKNTKLAPAATAQVCTLGG